MAKPIQSPLNLHLLFIIISITITSIQNLIEANSNVSRDNRVIQANNPENVIWIVQLSDLHFSVHNPDRALDFQNLIPSVLSFINPSLVLITGDLTDGKSKDLITMKQDEEEWVEYRNVMEEVVKLSGLDKSIFYDLRGNHDNFGVPSIGGVFDFFSNYSLNAQAGRIGNVNSITLQTGERRYLFVGVDSTMTVGLRGPTNLFGHPTDELLAELDSELSQWDAEPTKPVSKIAFGHFPLSFSATSESGTSLKDIFLKHSISAYLCGHLHTRFGRNLKRHHQLGNSLIQLNMHQTSSVSPNGSSSNHEFWEWEMGDWRKSRAMRVVAFDRGHASFVDFDFKSDSKKTIILPTFPLDSRLMWTPSLRGEYEHQSRNPSDYMSIRALVFSSSPIVSVVARVYDSKPGHLVNILEESMTKLKDNLYSVLWNFQAFQDPSPVRYWLEIEAIDIRGRSTVTELRPFSINGIRSFLSWTWKEFFVMGCQWSALYLPILWFILGAFLVILLLPIPFCFLSKKHYTLQNFFVDKGLVSGIGCVLTELYKLRLLWFGFLGYLFYLILFPWFSGELFTDGGQRGHMTYKGWVIKHPETGRALEFMGFPDVMVIVIPHLVFVVFPSIIVVMGFAVEREMYRINLLARSGKKVDDYNGDAQGLIQDAQRIGSRWIRKLLMIACSAILFKHFMSCRMLVKAYEMNPLLHFPVLSLSIPLQLVYAAYKTNSA